MRWGQPPLQKVETRCGPWVTPKTNRWQALRKDSLGSEPLRTGAGIRLDSSALSGVSLQLELDMLVIIERSRRVNGDQIPRKLVGRDLRGLPGTTGHPRRMATGRVEALRQQPGEGVRLCSELVRVRFLQLTQVVKLPQSTWQLLSMRIDSSDQFGCGERRHQETALSRGRPLACGTDRRPRPRRPRIIHSRDPAGKMRPARQRLWVRRTRADRDSRHAVVTETLEGHE